MCGIAGIVDYARPAAAHASRVTAMKKRLRHRGPDADAELVLEHVALAHTRLTILDAAGGAQPMVSADGRYVIVYNGELTNADALRASLDWTFRTRSDTEVVLAAYARWGASCAERLSGMFAFFVWDAALARGFAARDRLGVKPFFFARDEGAFVFASEAHAIARTSGKRVRANVAGILEVLVSPSFSGVAHAMFDGVEPLPAGCQLTFDRDGIRIEAHWDWPCSDGAPREDDPVRAIAALREAVPSAIRRSLVADVPIGLFSSGGLDSAMVAAVMAGQSPSADARIRAYTVTFDDQARFDYGRSTITGSDDTPYARDVAAAFDLDSRLVHVRRDEIAKDLCSVALANDALPVWEQEIAQHRLARAAAESLKVVLVGDAADETHYGYHFLLDRAALQGPRAVIERLGSAPIRAEIARHPRRDAARELESVVEEAGGSFAGDARGARDARDARDGRAHDGRVRAMTYLIVKRWLPRLLHNGDIHTMRWSLESRVPFADAELVDLASRIDPSIAMRGGTEKWALRESARGLLPEHVRIRKKSALPKDLDVEPVFRAEAAKVLRDPPPLVDAIVDLAALHAIVTCPEALTEAERAVLFRVVTLAHWARHHEVAAP